MEPDKRIFGLQKNVFFLGLVSLFNDFSSEMVYAVMPAFLTAVLGAPPIFIGFLEGFADALASGLKILFGWVSDKLQTRKKLAVLGYALSVSTRWFLAFSGSIWSVFALRSLDRVGKGLRDAPRDALIAESVRPAELGKSFGYHRAMDSIGSTIGPVAAFILLPLLLQDYRLLFKIGFAVGLIAIISFIFVNDIPFSKTSLPRSSFRAAWHNFSGEFKRYVATVFVFGLGFMPVSLLLLISRTDGLALYSIPFLYFLYNITYVIFSAPAGRLADIIGDRWILIFGFIAAILSYVILLIAPTAVGAILGFLVLGVYAALTDGVERALASKLVAREVLATGQGTLNAAIGFSSLIAGLIGGALWTWASPSIALGYGLVMMAIGSVMFIAARGFAKTV